MTKTAVGCLLAAGVLWFPATHGAAAEPATLVVDRDGVERGNAEFTSIQAAVDAAQPGDLIRVCPDVYTESAVVDKPLTLRADPDAVEAIDCFQPTPGELSTDQQAIVEPASDDFSIAFRLEADHVELAGFVNQEAKVGIDASDRFSRLPPPPSRHGRCCGASPCARSPGDQSDETGTTVRRELPMSRPPGSGTRPYSAC
jgi:hypothetical protein